MKYKKSYLTSLVLLAICAGTPGVQGQSIFLDPDVEYVTTGTGTEFELELQVDAGITSFRSFVYIVNFDPAKLGIVSVTQGPLLPSSPAGQSGTMFGSYIDDDRLEIEDLILGSEVVAGPGTVATIRFVVLDTGITELEVAHHRIRDVAGTLLATDAYGATIYANVPPETFELIAPTQGQEESGLPGDFISLSWEASASPYAGEGVDYVLEYSTSDSFGPGETSTVPGLTGVTHQLDVGDLTWGYEGQYYWRVTSVGDLYGFERLCSPVYETFDFSYTAVAPDPFDLVSPGDASGISGAAEVTFDWQDATSIIPGDEVGYTFYLATHPSVQAGVLLTEQVTASEVQASIAGLPRNQELYWRVAAEGNYSMITFSTSIFSVTLLGCCVDRVGDANGVGGDEPTIGDISVLIDAKFIGGTCVGILECFGEADVNQTGGLEPDCDDITIGDISVLIDYLFITGPSLGLVDCL